MIEHNRSKAAALAAAIALAMVATSAMAADPAAGQLPGHGKNVLGAPTVTVSPATTMTIALTANSVINWGTGTDYNKTGVAGFNIGAGGEVDVTGGFGLLNIDSTGGASQIFGKLDNQTGHNVYVANSNGIIVGASGVINGGAGAVYLLANSIATIYDPTTFNGTVTDWQGTGGNVTVQKGATMSSGAVYVYGGGVVNVDMSAAPGIVTVSAGLHEGTNPLAVDNPGALANVTGASTGSTLAELASDGTANTNGKLTVTSANVVGQLTNIGDLTLPGGGYGDVLNQGALTTSAAAAFGALTNNGTYLVFGGGFTGTGNLTNNGSIVGAGLVTITDGSIVNNGTITFVTNLQTVSDSHFTAGAAYSITNVGSITGVNNLFFDANSTPSGGVGDNTTGNFTNTGALTVGTAKSVTVDASGNINLGGAIKAGTKAVSATNPLQVLDLESFNNTVGDIGGGVTLSAPVTFSGAASVYGDKIKVLANLSDLGDGSGLVDIEGGDKMAGDYAIRIGAGVTVSADRVEIKSYDANSRANVILQGRVAGNTVEFGQNSAEPNFSVSDVFTGANGGVQVAHDGNGVPNVSFHFTGAIKTAPYLNDANNFRFNYLPITSTDGSAVKLTLDPVAYLTNGTTNGGMSAVNVLVSGGDAQLQQGSTLNTATVINGSGSAVTGMLNVPNTHLVVQSTGNITTGGGYYWPGYVYLGNISADANGNALPGTLGFGKINLGGNFSNVLPGDIAGASGIHFITQFPLVMGAFTVTTNATAWVNLGTALLTGKYSSGQNATTGPFFGGVQGPGNVINYGVLRAADFVTQPPNPTR